MQWTIPAITVLVHLLVVTVVLAPVFASSTSNSPGAKERFSEICTSRESLSVDVTDVEDAVERLDLCGVVFLRPGGLDSIFVSEMDNISRELLMGDDGPWTEFAHRDCFRDERRKVIIPPEGNVFDELAPRLAASPLIDLIYRFWPNEAEISMTFLTLLSSPDRTSPTVWHRDNTNDFLKIQWLLHDLDNEDSALLEVLPGCARLPRFRQCARCPEKFPTGYKDGCKAPYRVKQRMEAGSVALYSADTLHAGLGRAEEIPGRHKIVLDINIRKGSSDAPEDMATEFTDKALQIQLRRTDIFNKAASRKRMGATQTNVRNVDSSTRDEM